MASTKSAPKTLQQAIQYFSDVDTCQEALVAARWKDDVTCPTCGSLKVGYIKTRRVWECRGPKKHARRQFSAKVGTIFEDSPLGLDKWFVVIWMLANCKNGVSSYEIKRAIGVTQRTGWFMLSRVRLAMQRQSLEKMSGEVEADETYVGGKIRNMPRSRRDRMAKGRWAGKVAVMGLLERHPDRDSFVRTQIVSTVRRHELKAVIDANVEHDSHVYTDALGSYRALSQNYQHEFVDHMDAYVQGNVHTNGLESFWSLFKRTMRGTYVSAEPVHLFRYLDEATFRFNTRKLADNDRFSNVLDSVVGKRLTFKELTATEPS
jgi:transposase-like protein